MKTTLITPGVQVSQLSAGGELLPALPMHYPLDWRAEAVPPRFTPKGVPQNTGDKKGAHLGVEGGVTEGVERDAAEGSGSLEGMDPDEAFTEIEGRPKRRREGAWAGNGGGL